MKIKKGWSADSSITYDLRKSNMKNHLYAPVLGQVLLSNNYVQDFFTQNYYRYISTWNKPLFCKNPDRDTIVHMLHGGYNALIDACIMPSADIQVTDNLSVSLSPGIFLGTGRIGIGGNVSATYSTGNWAFSAGTSVREYRQDFGAGGTELGNDPDKYRFGGFFGGYGQNYNPYSLW